MEKRPEIVLHKVSLAYLYQILGNLPEAERLLKEAFKENPRDSRIQQSLVNLYILSQKLDKARDVLEKWLKYNPQDRKAQQTLNRLNRNR